MAISFGVVVIMNTTTLISLDLAKPEHSYFFGFVQGDGHLHKGVGRKGSLSIELAERDRWILERFGDLFPGIASIRDRQRDTNFKDGYRSSVLSICRAGFREQLIDAGLTVGEKSTTIAEPQVPFLAPDFYRGLVDADGSLGLDKRGLPFLSLTTSSDEMAAEYQAFLRSITGKAKQTNRNRRDDVYNIMVWKEDAREVVRVLYYVDCLGLPRKVQKSLQILSWERPEGMTRKDPTTRWSPEEDVVVLGCRPQEAIMLLSSRSLNAIKIRRNRLRRASRKDMIPCVPSPSASWA